MPRSRPMSTRSFLRAYQKVREAADREGFNADLDMLQAKDLDLSVRLGALLAFDALMVSAAINPIAASPGAPLSLNVAAQPWEVLAISVSIVLLGISAILCVRAIMLGEEFGAEGIEDDPQAIVQRMFAAYCTSIDYQQRAIKIASWFAIAGGVACVIACGWIMIDKLGG